MNYRIPGLDDNGYRSKAAADAPSPCWTAMLILAICLTRLPTVMAGTDLSLDETVNLAIAREDPTVARHIEASNALTERAISDSQLPDPQLRLELANWPTDSFAYEQDPMTQVQVGIKQQFPRGKTLKVTRMRIDAESDVEQAAAALQLRQVVLEARSSWIELYYWHRARETVTQSREAVRKLVEVVESSFATGLQSNQDLLRAELELSLLDDRAVDVERQIETRKVDLARFIGMADASRNLTPLVSDLPRLPEAEQLQGALLEHPALRMEDARVRVGTRNIDIAKEQYKPGFSVDVGYGARGANRADFASVMVLVDIPLFTANRQDRRLASAQHDRAGAEMDRAARLLELKQALDRTYADWLRLGERTGLYEKVVVQRAASNAEAALAGYQSQVSDFSELIRSRLDYLEIDLKLRRLETDRALAHSRLLFLAGEDR